MLLTITNESRPRKYNSYKGEVGARPYEKCYTDVTEFALPEGKLYLSPVLDGFNSEIIAYNISQSPNLEQLHDMLGKAFPDETYQGTILHSDQGWQYQH